MNPLLPPELLELLMPVPFSGCWVFLGPRFSRNGYGRFKWLGKERQVHKLVWEFLHGPVPAGMVLDHLCRIRSCAWDGHLEPVTHRVNTARGLAVLFAREVRP